MRANLQSIVELGLEIKTVLGRGDTNAFADLMHEHWLRKRKRSAGMSNADIDLWYDAARANGRARRETGGGRRWRLPAALLHRSHRRASRDDRPRAGGDPLQVRFRRVRDLAQALTVQCVILAGGLGTRIRPVSGGLPKTLIPVAGRPFAARQLEWLHQQGVSDVVYCIGHKGSLIRDLVGDGRDFGVSVSYCDEGEELRGTGGGDPVWRMIAGCWRRDSSLYTAIHSCRSWIAPIWQRTVEDGRPLMVIIQNDGRWDASNVVFHDGRVVRYEKNLPDPAGAGMRFIDYGLSVLTCDVVSAGIPAGAAFDLAALYTTLSREGRLSGYEVSERFYEIGSPQGTGGPRTTSPSACKRVMGGSAEKAVILAAFWARL